MLIDYDLNEDADPRTLQIFALIARGNQSPPLRLDEGIYQINHFGCSNWPVGLKQDMEIPALAPGDPGALREAIDAMMKEEKKYGPWYGVCDDYENILDKYPKIKTCPKRKFVLTLTPIVRAEQPKDGGWRWHKWGRYIGKHKKRHEYLYDEKNIDKVYVYHRYEKVD